MPTETSKSKISSVEALLSCPRFNDNKGLDIERDHSDFGREITLGQNKRHARLVGVASSSANPSLRNRERTAFSVAMEAKHASKQPSGAFSDLCGILTKEEADELRAAQADFNVIDYEMWK